MLTEWFSFLDIPLSPEERPLPAFLCAEIETPDLYKSRVIEQDVARTRADETFYANKSIRCLMKEVLMRYCAHYRLQYMQGLNEILAPFLKLVSPHTTRHEQCSLQLDHMYDESSSFPMEDCDQETCMMHHRSCPQRQDNHTTTDNNNTKNSTTDENNHDFVCTLCQHRQSFNTSLLLFERFIALLAPVTFATEGVQALQTQLASVHLLLYYIDAELASYLSQQGMTTDIFAPSWLITLFARRLPVAMVLHLWSLLLRGGRACRIMFFGIALLLRNKAMLMSLPSESLPGTLVRLNVENKDEIDQLYEHAVALETSVPASALEDINRYTPHPSILTHMRSHTPHQCIHTHTLPHILIHTLIHTHTLHTLLITPSSSHLSTGWDSTHLCPKRRGKSSYSTSCSAPVCSPTAATSRPPS